MDLILRLECSCLTECPLYIDEILCYLYPEVLMSSDCSRNSRSLF
jgi:hypothetical protein